MPEPRTSAEIATIVRRYLAVRNTGELACPVSAHHEGRSASLRGAKVSVTCLACGAHCGDLPLTRVSEMESFLELLDSYDAEADAPVF